MWHTTDGSSNLRLSSAATPGVARTRNSPSSSRSPSRRLAGATASIYASYWLSFDSLTSRSVRDNVDKNNCDVGQHVTTELKSVCGIYTSLAFGQNYDIELERHDELFHEAGKGAAPVERLLTREWRFECVPGLETQPSSTLLGPQPPRMISFLVFYIHSSHVHGFNFVDATTRITASLR